MEKVKNFSDSSLEEQMFVRIIKADLYKNYINEFQTDNEKVDLFKTGRGSLFDAHVLRGSLDAIIAKLVEKNIIANVVPIDDDCRQLHV
jgi:hypothetical protein